MSYYTEIRISFFGEEFKRPLWKRGPISADMLLAEARSWLDQSEWRGSPVDDIMGRLTPGFESGSTSLLDLGSFDITRMFLAISKKYPTVTLRVWGHGESWKDVWTREFKGGEVTFEQGPFGER